ncbi:PIR Superfamily Protein [Plasmodium ovale wallikeri]|uniref:PIR Superfamily Protein n=1 Tax=Plasmodium ovale wallikeri TaxID=864142 RepID=A0A1A9AKY4_PLAOA|nr:PIR Superfamily Protein [Plasmodium ovale wallikeri]SBT57602.1 PIR Superfamily Protein [Plasmodium ovale wallikeri]
MPTSEKFTYDELENNHAFLKNLTFSKIYGEFNNKTKFDVNGKTYCEAIKDILQVGSYDDDLLLSFCNILYKIIVHVNGISNDHFEEIPKDDQMYCVCLKYWLYDQIGNIGAKNLGASDIFENYQNNIKSKAKQDASNPCTFSVLKWEEIDKLRSIYAFILIYYRNINTFYGERNMPCKYLNYFGKGLKAYYESLSECSNEKEGDNYCKEFNEFKNIYGLDEIYWETTKEYEKYSYYRNDSEQCALKIESHNNPLHLSYWYNEEKLHLSNQPIDFHKSTIISASSALGATAGISAFLIYLFKFTNIRSLFGHGKQQDNTMFLNMEEESHDFTFPVSDSKHTNFGNNQYNISYLSVDNS